MQPVSDFLARFAPFDRLGADELEHVAAAAVTREYRRGADVLVENGSPAAFLYVIRRGAMALIHEGETVDVLASGECFGHTSVLTGLAPSFTVRAHEDSSCLLIPREVALEVLGRPDGARHLAVTLRERLTRTEHAVHALPELRGAHVRSLLRRPPLFCDPDTPIRNAARSMTEQRQSAVLVPASGGLGIVTDRDLRSRVVAGDVPVDAAIARIMTSPVRTVSADSLASEAMLDMLEAGIHHLPVVEPDGEISGVITAEELASLEERSPFALRRAIAVARDEDALVELSRRLPELFLLLVDSGLSPPEIGRVLAFQSDAFTIRLMDFAVTRFGQPPAPWAWLALGSVARRELTLASDQDNALAYAAPGGPEVDAYFERFATLVNAGLSRCGFGADTADVLARNRAWRMTDGEWQAEFRACLDTPDRSHLVRAAVAFDFRHIVGGLEIGPALVALLQTARDHPDFLGRLARTVTDLRPAWPKGGLARRLRHDGDGYVDLKLGAVVPIANLARFHALACGVTISGTLDRLTAAERVGALDADTARALREAFLIVARLRLEHHATDIAASFVPDNLVDLERMSSLARSELREVFGVVAAAQKRLAHYVPLGL